MEYMLHCMHESDKLKSYHRHSEAVIGISRRNSRSVDRGKDLRDVAAFGGADIGMGCSTLWPASIQCAPVGATRKSERGWGVDREAAARTSWTVDGFGATAAGDSFREASRTIWLGTGSMGWPHLGATFEATFWSGHESAPSPTVAASDGVSDEASRLCVRSSQGRRRASVPKTDKKNS